MINLTPRFDGVSEETRNYINAHPVNMHCEAPEEEVPNVEYKVVIEDTVVIEPWASVEQIKQEALQYNYSRVVTKILDERGVVVWEQKHTK